MVLHQASPALFGVGQSGLLDVESLMVNEVGHVMYGDHNPNWTDGNIQLNACTWGSISCYVTNDTLPGFNPYTVTCSNCGNRRAFLPGDDDLLTHIYGFSNYCNPVCAPMTGALTPDDAALLRDPTRSAVDQAVAVAARLPNANPADYVVLVERGA